MPFSLRFRFIFLSSMLARRLFSTSLIKRLCDMSHHSTLSSLHSIKNEKKRTKRKNRIGILVVAFISLSLLFSRSVNEYIGDRNDQPMPDTLWCPHTHCSQPMSRFIYDRFFSVRSRCYCFQLINDNNFEKINPIDVCLRKHLLRNKNCGKKICERTASHRY